MSQVVDPVFRPHLDVLLDSPFTGNFFQNLSLRKPRASGPSVFTEEALIDHFTVHIPYAGYNLVWEIRFDSSCPDLAPDFLFDDDSFTRFLNIDLLLEHVPSLVNWNHENPKCLRNVILELLNLYTRYQRKRIEKDGSSLGDDCSKMMDKFNMCEDQLQVLSGDYPILPHYFPNSTRPNLHSVSVMVHNLQRNLNFGGIPEQCWEMALQLIIREYSPSMVMLHVDPVLIHLLGGKDILEIPNFSKADGLTKYLYTLLRAVQETLNQVCESYDKRKTYHLSILHELTNLENISVTSLESDMPLFSSSSYMIEIEHYLVTITFTTPSNSSLEPKVNIGMLQGKSYEIATSWDAQKTIESVINHVMDFRENSDDLV